MKLAIIGTVGLPARYGGWETLADFLVQRLSTTHDITVYCSSTAYQERQKEYHGAKLIYLPLKANGIQSIFYDAISIIHAVWKSDILLILGVSGCIILPLVKMLTRKKIIVNIDGLEWMRHKWGAPARWFLKFSERIAVLYADVVVADNEAIRDYVQDAYKTNSVLIEYGSDHAQKANPTEALRALYIFLGRRYLFSVCRIEPENNVHTILEALASQTTYDLVIVGNWNNSRYGKKLFLRYGRGVHSHIHLFPPIYDHTTLNVLRSNCFAYVHGHSAGGSNPSLIEAMRLKLPIIAFDVNFNRITTENKALYFRDKDHLILIINISTSDKLKDMANSMYEIARIRYRWDIICAKYSELIER